MPRATMTHLIQMAKDNPNSTTGDLQRAYANRYGHKPSWTTARKAQDACRVKDDFQNLQLAPTIEGVADTPFVSDALLQSIGRISVATRSAGGHKVALDLASAIDAVGGTDNFRRAVNLLEAIEGVSPRRETPP